MLLQGSTLGLVDIKYIHLIVELNFIKFGIPLEISDIIVDKQTIPQH